jgi:hypothetical protein
MAVATKTQMISITSLLLLVPSVAPAAPIMLAVPEVEQEQTEWCWAGVSDAVLQYWGMELHQCELAEYTRQVSTWHDFGDVDCCVDPSQGCNQPNVSSGHDGSVQDILEHFGGISSSSTGSALSASAVATEVSAGRPFIPRWGWDAGGGHFIVGHGFEGEVETETGVCDIGDPPGGPIVQEPVVPSTLYEYGPFELFSGSLTFNLECPPGQADLYIKEGSPASPQNYDHVFSVPAAYTATEPGQYYVAVQALASPPFVFELYRTCQDVTVVDMDLYYMNPWPGEGLTVSAYDWVVNGSVHTWTHTTRISTTPSCICSTVDACCDGCRPFEDGTPCDDGDPLTTGETCIAGICRSCPADFEGSGDVGFADLTQLLSVWGACATSCPEDLDGNGAVGFADLTSLLSAWGPCGS